MAWMSPAPPDPARRGVKVKFAYPLEPLVDRYFYGAFRADALPGTQYTDPLGDVGWFGPGTAIWYVNSHPSVLLGGIAGLTMEPVHPVFAAAQVHSSVYKVGHPSEGGFVDASVIRAEALRRLGRSVSFVLGTTYGSSDTADKLTKIVRGMHTRVTGTLASGTAYSANDPDALRYAYATLAYGWVAAHRRYHPRPLRADDLDRYFGESAQVASALGAEDLPTTLVGVEDYFSSMVPHLAVTEWTLEILDALDPKRLPLSSRAIGSFIIWAVMDLLPDWTRRFYRIPRLSPVQTVSGRALMWTLLNTVYLAGGPPREAREALERVRSSAGESGAGNTPGLKIELGTARHAS
jgi:uncharacterized protein (DUF2236 family)